MASTKFDRQEAGKPIAAKTLNRPIAVAEQLSGMSFEAPLSATRTAGGSSVRVVLPPVMDARITDVGGGGLYGWQGIAPDADSPGDWLDLPTDISGTTTTDPLLERNGNDLLAVGTRVEMKRCMGQWITTYDRCS
jgi:hypothetical protein